MLVSVGMYLPFQTTFAIFIGGLIRWVGDSLSARRGYNEAQRARVENAGILTASGLIAGEALMGLIWSGMQFLPPDTLARFNFENHSYLIGSLIMLGIAAILIYMPMGNAGSPDEPAPPVAMM
jgi:hypothetical protein